MRHCFYALAVLLLASANIRAADDKPAPITPAHVASKVNEEVTLQMEVKSASTKNGLCFLNSEADFKDAKNVTVFIDKKAMEKFKEGKIEDPAAQFKGKTVQVKGKVTLHNEKPEIKVAGPDAITVVEKAS
jgi:DNA/RNA endonuclease YhcR with UshA esterase domain